MCVHSSGTCYHILDSFRVLVIDNFQNVIVFKPASLYHCLLVACRLGSLAHKSLRTCMTSFSLNQLDE